MYILSFLICFGASIVGAICGIGGGVIIKPTLDAFGVGSVAAVSFLSGCTVLAMSSYSVLRAKLTGGTHFDRRVGLPLAIGGAAGGIAGKAIFTLLEDMSADKQQVGAIQAVCLLIVTVGTLLYALFKSRIKTHSFSGTVGCLAIGAALGVISSFLGIGGGPINLVLLFFFFSMETKTAAECSLYIIFFSQLTSLLQSLISGRVPQFAPALLILMIFGGICGGVLGRAMNKKLRSESVDRLFIALMIVMIGINIYDIVKFI
jgi:uncharacterized membrane protein YfcA